MELYATYNDVDVFFSRFEDGTKFCQARKRIVGKYDICPFCREEIKDRTILLLLNNFKLFPNVIVHEDCCDHFPTKENAIADLHADHQEALKYKHWFNVE